MALADEKPAGAWLELFFHELELPLGEPKSLHVIVRIRVRIWEKDLGRGLLDQRPADGTAENIARALGGECHDAIQFPPGLGSILREALEGGIGQQPPELVHPADEPSTVEKVADQMKEVERDRRPG